ncbi:MAG: glycosyl hydrolase family 28-related protein [Limnochordia bacterium]
MTQFVSDRFGVRRLVWLVSFLALSCLVTGSLTAWGEAAATWRSALYPENWTPAFADGEGRYLHDFSYAGYYAGEKPLPESVPGPRVDVTQAPYHADHTGVESASLAIQQAINDVGRAGGGTVYLPPGTYRLTLEPYRSEALLVAYSNVVVQGAGLDKTFLFLDETVTRGKAMIRVTPALTGVKWSDIDGQGQMLRTDVAARDTVIPLSGPPHFAVGEWVVLQYDCTPEWVAEHNMSDGWDSSIGGPAFYREIVAVDTTENTITLDTPLRYAVKVRDKGRVHRVSQPLIEVGLADFAISMREHPSTSGWGNNDHGTFGTGAYDVHSSSAVSFNGVINSWVRDIATYKAPGNTYAHIHSIGFNFSRSRFLTIRRVSVENPQYRGGGGNGYPFVVGTQDSLYDSLRAINGRHNFTITGQRASGNVIYRGYISNPIRSLAADFHAYLSMANLIDNLIIDNDRFEAADRSGAAGVAGFPKHGVTTTQSVFWNNEGLSYPLDRPAIIRSDQYGWGYIIGTRGPAFRVALGVSERTAPEDYLEGEGLGASLQPQSLYVDQLERRLLREGKANRWEAVREGLTPPPITEWESVEPEGLRRSLEPELPLIYQEDFENALIDILPDGWDQLRTVNSPDMPQVVQAPAELGASSGQVLCLGRTAGTSNVTGQAVFNFPPVSERLVLSFDMFTTTERRNLRVTLGGSDLMPQSVHGTTANAGLFIAMNGGRILALLDSKANTWAFGGSYGAGRWHTVTFDVNIKEQTFNMYVDDAVLPGNAEPISFYRGYSDLCTLAFSYQSISSHNNTDPVYVDNVRLWGE